MNVSHFHTTVVRSDENTMLVKSNPTGMHYLVYLADAGHNYSAFKATPDGEPMDMMAVARCVDLHDLMDMIYALR